MTIRHAGGSGPVLIEAGSLARLPALLDQYLPGRRRAVITDSNVGPLYGAAAGAAAERFEFPAGERSKTRDTWGGLTDRLLAAGHGRDSAIVALGGGVTGDLAGFVAATLGRGVPWVYVPTTLLAMIDASIGGKTGVDTPAGKNLVGAFHPPVAVVTDPAALATLPDPELRTGVAEALKHGLICDADYFDRLTADAAAVMARDPATIAWLIGRSVAIKAEIVSADERDSGRRAVLNAGHTVAHAIELASGFAVAHGTAVGIGLLAEAMLSEMLGVADPGTASCVREALAAYGLPVSLPAGLDADRVCTAMATDKKSREGQPHFVLLQRPGSVRGEGGCWTVAAPRDRIVAAIDGLSGA